MSAERLSLLASAAFFSSAMLMFPFESVPTDTIFIPHMAALAGLVPCADSGMRHTSRWWSPLACGMIPFVTAQVTLADIVFFRLSLKVLKCVHEGELSTSLFRSSFKPLSKRRGISHKGTKELK